MAVCAVDVGSLAMNMRDGEMPGIRFADPPVLSELDETISQLHFPDLSMGHVPGLNAPAAEVRAWSRVVMPISSEDPIRVFFLRLHCDKRSCGRLLAILSRPHHTSPLAVSGVRPSLFNDWPSHLTHLTGAPSATYKTLNPKPDP